MHLTRIQIKNFRSLQDVTVSLQSGLNVIVGRNNTGKSNLLAAIRHAIGPRQALEGKHYGLREMTSLRLPRTLNLWRRYPYR